MGTFRVAVQIGDPEGTRFETVEALVDTGACYTWVPASLLKGLQVPRRLRGNARTGGPVPSPKPTGDARRL